MYKIKRLYIIIFLVSFFNLFNLVLADTTINKKIYIMLDVDNTITDRIDPDNLELKNKLISQGYLIYNINFKINKNNHFYNYYKKRLIRHNKNYNPNSDNLNIEESIVVSPNIQDMIKAIIDLGKSLNTPVYILVCSRKDITRTVTLINNLNLNIDNKPLKELADIVPREFFRLETIIEGKPTPVKSAKLLREKYNGKYGKILQNDFVILIDQLPDNRFIISDQLRDLNIYIHPFEIGAKKQEFNIASDRKLLLDSVKRIKNFVIKQ